MSGTFSQSKNPGNKTIENLQAESAGLIKRYHHFHLVYMDVQSGIEPCTAGHPHVGGYSHLILGLLHCCATDLALPRTQSRE